MIALFNWPLFFLSYEIPVFLLGPVSYDELSHIFCVGSVVTLIFGGQTSPVSSTASLDSTTLMTFNAFVFVYLVISPLCIGIKVSVEKFSGELVGSPRNFTSSCSN